MRSRALPLLALGAALVAGCVSQTLNTADSLTAGGIDTDPMGPAFPDVRASGEGSSVSPGAGVGRFRVAFPAGDGKPAATFTFAETDINDRLGVAVDVRNNAGQPIRIFADLNGDTWVRGYATVPAGGTRTVWIFARRLKLAAADAAKFPLMHGIPGGKMSLWAGIAEPVKASGVRLFAVMPRSAAAIEVGNIRPFGSSKVPDDPGFFPFIDQFGQYLHKEWPGKTHSYADLSSSIGAEDRDLAGHRGATDRDRYGGWMSGPLLGATGHFRVEKYKGKWWFVDPDGRLFWSDGIDCVGFAQSFTPIEGRERFFEYPAPKGDFLARNLRAKYGPDWRADATARILRRLTSWGINTLGSWSDPTFMGQRTMPYALMVSSGPHLATIDPDSPAWVAGMRTRLADAAKTAANDPLCIGYFVDNEIHTSLDPAWFERYYSQVSAAGREMMPHTLYLGSRLDYHDWPDVPEFRKEIVRIAARYCDVVSFNFYKFTLDDVAMPEGVDKPLIVGEFHMGALDRGKFHTGLRSVFNQNQRAEAYRYYVTSALRNPAVVGAHWFQLFDEATTGRGDGEDYQIGFLDICDTPYAETVAAARDMGYRIYAIRSGSE